MKSKDAASHDFPRQTLGTLSFPSASDEAWVHKASRPSGRGVEILWNPWAKYGDVMVFSCFFLWIDETSDPAMDFFNTGWNHGEFMVNSCWCNGKKKWASHGGFSSDFMGPVTQWGDEGDHRPIGDLAECSLWIGVISGFHGFFWPLAQVVLVSCEFSRVIALTDGICGEWLLFLFTYYAYLVEMIRMKVPFLSGGGWVGGEACVNFLWRSFRYLVSFAVVNCEAVQIEMYTAL